MQGLQHCATRKLMGCSAALFLGLTASTEVSWAKGTPTPIVEADPLAAEIEATLAPYFAADRSGASVIVTRNGKALFRNA